CRDVAASGRRAETSTLRQLPGLRPGRSAQALRQADAVDVRRWCDTATRHSARQSVLRSVPALLRRFAHTRDRWRPFLSGRESDGHERGTRRIPVSPASDGAVTMSTQQQPSPLVSTDWLAERLGANDLRVFDATVHLRAAQPGPYVVESGRADYESAHIPGAAFADLAEDLS